MKINKEKLKRIIAEEAKRLAEGDEDTSLGTTGTTQRDKAGSKLRSGTMSTQQRVKSTRTRIQGHEEEFTAQEKSLVNQVEEYISNLAAMEEVDLVQHRSLLQRILDLLKNSIEKPARRSSS